MASSPLLLLFFTFFFFSIPHPSDANYCVCNAGSGDAALQKNIDYACGHGADCSAIQPNGACYNPNTIKDHCSYAVNSYYQKKGQTSGSCDFQGTATVTPNPPTPTSGASGCSFQSTPSSGGSTTPGTGGTIAPPTSPTGGVTPTTPNTGGGGGGSMAPPTSPTTGGSPTTPTGGGMNSPTTSPGTGGTPTTPNTGGISTPGAFPGTTSPGIGFGGPTASPFGSTDSSDGAKFSYMNGWATLVVLTAMANWMHLRM